MKEIKKIMLQWDIETEKHEIVLTDGEKYAKYGVTEDLSDQLIKVIGQIIKNKEVTLGE